LLHGILRLQEKIAAEQVSGAAIGQRRRPASAGQLTRPLVGPGGSGPLRPAGS